MNNLLNIDIHISVISNIVFEPKFAPLIKSHFGENTKIFSIPYGEYNDKEYQKKLAESDIIVVWLNYQSLFPDVWNTMYSHIEMEQQVIVKNSVLCEKLHSDLLVYSNAQVLWFAFEDYALQSSIFTGHHYNTFIDMLNLKLYGMLGKNVTFIDLKHLIASIGIPNAYDLKGKYRWNAVYSDTLVQTAVKEIHKQYLIEKGITKKCLVLDCDNVLWGGILSEDGIENIKLGGSGFGRAYQDFQRFILLLYHHGTILAVCSKNDLFDVMIIFREHNEMILREEHIACFQVNWGNKPDNIKKISDTLNIGLNSIVFVDDSPIEIEAVKAIHPDVSTILYERDTVYEQFSCLNLKSNVSRADIEKRNETYRTNQSRETLKSQYDSYADYINALNIKMDIHEATPIEYSRISELTQRTNKCTNGRRYTVAEIKEHVASVNVRLYSLSVSDCFSDLGLVGALEVEGNTLTLFSLSCRALGREIEGKLLESIADKQKITSIEFKPTGKNEALKTLLLKVFPNAVLTNCEFP